MVITICVIRRNTHSLFHLIENIDIDVFLLFSAVNNPCFARILCIIYPVDKIENNIIINCICTYIIMINLCV